MPLLYVPFEDRLIRVRATDSGWVSELILEGRDFEAVAAHPDPPDTLLVGTDGDGLLRSLDGGDSWHESGPGSMPATISALASDPTDPAVFYAGTEPSRVFETADAGETWTEFEGLTDLDSASSWAFPPRPSTHHVRWIEVDPTDPDHLYVAIEAGALVRSFDGGATWVDRVPDGPRDTHEMTTHPEAPGSAWAAAGDGFAATSDGGDSWRFVEGGLDHRYCWSVAVDPGDASTVLVSAATGPRTAHTASVAESYVYRQERAGQHGEANSDWELAGEGLPHGSGMLRPVIRAGSEPGEAYLATNLGLWRTESMGTHWTRIEVDWPAALESQTARGLVVL